MMRGCAIVCAAAATMLLATPIARAATAASFEEAASAARPVRDLGDLVEPLFVDCKSDDDLEARQCQAVRDWLIETRAGETFVGFGDEAALSFAPYDASEKKLQLEVSGCLACGKPLKLEGDDRPRFVTTRVPKSIRAGHAVGLEVGFDEVTIDDEAAAQKWQKKMGQRLRVQFVFKLGATWKSGTFEGVTFVPIAHRVVDRCTGKVVASDPPSTTDAQATPDEHCPVELTEAERLAQEEAGLPEQLTNIDINMAMAKLRSRVHDCAAEFEVAGTAVARLVVLKSGKFESITMQPPFDKTPTGYCLRTAIQSVTMPRFRGAKMIINYPFQLK
jgi:hypothetical protein